MTDPKHAIATDYGRYYVDPATGEHLMSVTNALDKGVAKHALVPWAAKVVAEHFAEHLPAAVKASRDRKALQEFVREAKQQVNVVRETAKDRGSRVHAHAEAHVLGQPMPDDPEVAPYVAQYLRFLNDFRVDLGRHVEAAECTVLHRGFRYGGTADLWARLPTGERGRRELWLIDLKTSDKKPAGTVYDSHVLQLAALRYAQVALAPDDTEFAVPAFAKAAVLNLRPKTYGLVPVPADERAHNAFLAALTTAYYLHDLDTKSLTALDPPAVRPVTSKEGAA